MTSIYQKHLLAHLSESVGGTVSTPETGIVVLTLPGGDIVIQHYLRGNFFRAKVENQTPIEFRSPLQLIEWINQLQLKGAKNVRNKIGTRTRS